MNNSLIAPRCFLICPLGEFESTTRNRTDKLLKHVVGPAAERAGFTMYRADHIEEPGDVLSQVVGGIFSCGVVVADLTDHNPNVFYELGYAHALQRPTILLLQRGQKPPFDLGKQRYIQYDLSDPDSVADSVQRIGKQFQACASGTSRDFRTPMEEAIRVAASSGNPDDRELGEVHATLGRLQRTLVAMRRQNRQGRRTSLWNVILENRPRKRAVFRPSQRD